jgi:hypothetical protein
MFDMGNEVNNFFPNFRSTIGEACIFFNICRELNYVRSRYTKTNINYTKLFYLLYYPSRYFWVTY